MQPMRRNSRDYCDMPIGLQSSEDEAKDDSLDDSANVLIHDEKPSPKPLSLKLLAQESMLLTEDELSVLVGDLHLDISKTKNVKVPRVVKFQQESPVRPLEILLQRLKQTKDLNEVKDFASEFTIEGRNILHYIATEPEFTRYKKVLSKLYNKQPFIRLITQKTEEGETPLHVLCSHQNAPMLSFMLRSKIKDLTEHLRASGLEKTKTLRCNVFLCFGHSLQDKVIKNAYSEQMFDLLVQLYGPHSSALLLKEKDSEEYNFIDRAAKAKQHKLVEKATDIIAKNFV